MSRANIKRADRPPFLLNPPHLLVDFVLVDAGGMEIGLEAGATGSTHFGRLCELALALGSLGVFLELAVLLHLPTFDQLAPFDPSTPLPWFLTVRGLPAVPRFAALALAGVALAEGGHLRVAVAIPFMFGMIPVALGTGTPPIGAAAGWPSPWTGAVLEALIACGPAVGVALGGRARREAAPAGMSPAGRRAERPHAMLGVALTALPAALLFLTVRIVDGFLPPETIAAAAVLFVFGSSLGRRAGWWPWAHVGVAILLGFPFQTARYDPAGLIIGWLPLLTVVLWSAQHDRIARAVERLAGSPRRLIVVVNVLNIADAVLTQIAIDRGRALEANPIVGAAGMGAKVVLVAGASVLLYRLRPKMLLIPCVLLTGVLAYHLAGWTW